MTDVTRRPGGTPLTGGAPLDEGTPRTAQDTGRGADIPHTAPHPRSGDTPPTGPGRDRTTATDAGKPAAATGTDTGTHTLAHAQHGGASGSGSALGSGTHDRLLPHDDTDQLAAQLQHAVAGFVDAPREAVQEADDVLRELADRFAEAVAERRRTLRRSWETAGTAGPGDGQAAAATDTEQLRLALRDYRELADRLLHV